MSKLHLTVRIPADYNRQTWFGILSDIERQVNSLSEGVIAALYSSNTSPPGTGLHNKGDFIRNSSPTVSGTAPNEYVTYGWICTVAGEPGTFRECRFTVGETTITPLAGSITFTGVTPTVT